MVRCGLYCLTVLMFLVLPLSHGAYETTQKQSGNNVFRIGVLAFRGIQVTLERWQPTAEYLSASIPQSHFEIVPVTNDNIGRMVEMGKIDFILTNPASYATLETEFGIRRLATLLNAVNGGTNTMFGAVILSRSDRHDILSLADLKHKSFMAVHRNAFGGWWMAQRELQEAGIDPYKDLTKISFVRFPQDQIVFAVRDGLVDAGTVRTSVLERLSELGEINLNDFKILNPMKSFNFHHRLSTRLYPEWPLAAARHVSHLVTHEVALALLNMPENSVPARSALIRGWTAPLNYQPVHELMQELRVGPYKSLGKVSVDDVLKNYWQWIVGAFTLFFLMATASTYAIGQNRRNLYITRQLEREIKVRAQLEGRLKYQASHDSLTGIPNRTLLLDRLRREILRNNRDKTFCAVALIDLDDFKVVNDQLGHEYGDKLLKQVAKRLQEGVRKTDTIARFGGDEFVLLLRQLESKENVLALVEKSLSVLNDPFVLGGKKFKIRASTGIAIYPEHGNSVDLLIRHADLAMYFSKRASIRISVFDPDKSSANWLRRQSGVTADRPGFPRSGFRRT